MSKFTIDKSHFITGEKMEKTLNLLMGRQLSGPQLKALGVALDHMKKKTA